MRLFSANDRFPSICPEVFTLRYKAQRTSQGEGPGARPPNTREAFTTTEPGLWGQSHILSQGQWGHEGSCVPGGGLAGARVGIPREGSPQGKPWATQRRASLCDSRQVTLPLWASAASSVKEG